MEKQLGKPVNVKEREGRGTSRIDAYGKDFATRLADFQNNPSQIAELSPEEQMEWAGGFFDSQATVGATESKEPLIQIVNENEQKLEQFQNILSDLDIESTLEREGEKNPKLRIKGSKNLKKLQQNLPIRHPEKAEKLSDLIADAEWYESPERLSYTQDRANLGTEFENWFGENLEHIKPDAERLETSNLTDSEGNTQIPDFMVRNSDGTTEVIEIKLSDENIDDKDEQYPARLGADSGTIYRLEGEPKPDKNVGGKPISYGTKDDLSRALKEAKDKAKSEKEQDDIQKGMDELENLWNSAKDLKEKKQNKGKNNNEANESNPLNLENQSDSINHLNGSSPAIEIEDSPPPAEEPDKDAGGGENKDVPKEEDKKAPIFKR